MSSLNDAQQIARRLNMLTSDYINKESRQKLLGKAAQPVLAAVRNRAPVGSRRRKNTLDGIKRSGALRDSIQIFRSSRDRDVSTVLVGNVLNKRSRISKVKGQTLSKAKNKRAYYASIILAKNKRSWTPGGGKRNQKPIAAYDYIEQGYRASKAQSEAIIVREGNSIIQRFIRDKAFR